MSDDGRRPCRVQLLEITALYETLHELSPSPVVALNRAVAVAMADGPVAGLAPVDELARTSVLTNCYLLSATRADLLRLGRYSEAATAYRPRVGARTDGR